MTLLPLTQVVECDGAGGLCMEALEIRVLRPERLRCEIEDAMEEYGWGDEPGGHFCPAHRRGKEAVW